MAAGAAGLTLSGIVSLIAFAPFGEKRGRG